VAKVKNNASNVSSSFSRDWSMKHNKFIGCYRLNMRIRYDLRSLVESVKKALLRWARILQTRLNTQYVL